VVSRVQLPNKEKGIEGGGRTLLHLQERPIAVIRTLELVQCLQP